MKITVDGNQNNINRDTIQNSEQFSKLTKVDFGKNCVLNKSNFIDSVDNNAYGEIQKTTDMQSLFSNKLDQNVERKLMTVMSNCMSEEDFGRAMKDGFKPSDMEAEEMVTIVDHIKAEMAKSGVVVKGYNDDLSETELKEILGNFGQAKQIAETLKANDLAVNENNLKAVEESLKKASEIENLDDAAKKYLLQNKLELSVDHLYKAHFSAAGDGKKQSQGYYPQEMNGYYAHKAESIDWNEMLPQLKSSLSKMKEIGGDTDANMEKAKWIVEKGLPLTEEAIQKLNEIEGLTFPLDKNDVIKAAVASLVMGQSAGSLDLIHAAEMPNLYEKAVKIKDAVNKIKPEAIANCIENQQEIHIKNLVEAQSKLQIIQERGNTELNFSANIKMDSSFITAERQLREVQLSMTVTANVRLLKSDFQIETAGLSELVDALKQEESKLQETVFGSSDAITNKKKNILFNQSRDILKELPFLPAKTIGKFIGTDENVSIKKVHESGKILQKEYELAKEHYETLLTSPRKDLGDSIKKAFRNVDEILDDLHMERIEENRKSIRILGYNNLELSEDNINKVKEMLLQLENVHISMSPKKILQLIREGINPLDMGLNELEQKLLSMEDNESENLKFARFLYQLEQKQEVSEKEKNAYIGVYRLFRQIEKTDGAMLGGLMASGMNLTLGNILTSLRTQNHGKMDYSVNDEFAGIDAVEGKKQTISEQIEAGVNEARMLHGLYRDISVEGLKNTDLNSNTSLKELREAFLAEQFSSTETVINDDSSKDKQSLGYENLQNDISRKEIEVEKELIQRSIKAEDEIYKLLEENKLPITAENILATEKLYEKENTVYQLLERFINEKKEKEEQFSGLMNLLTEKLNSKEEVMESLSNIKEFAEEIFMEQSRHNVNSALDLREIQSCMKQLSVMTKMSQEENYHLALQLGDELTSIHLSLEENTEETASVKIATENRKYGKIAIKYSYLKEQLHCYGMFEKEEKEEEIQKLLKAVDGRLEAAGLKIMEERLVHTEKEVDLLRFSLKDDDNNISQSKTKELYQIAKVFLEELKSES